MKKNENGFGAVEIILTIVILGLVGGLGFYLYNKNQPKDESNKTQTQNSTAAPQGLTEASAAETVNDFYDKYVELDPTGNPETQEAFLKQYGTDKLLMYFEDNQSDTDPIVCAQNTPESFEITSSTISQSTATVAVNEIFGTEKVSLTATVIDQNGLKIDTIKCPVHQP